MKDKKKARTQPTVREQFAMAALASLRWHRDVSHGTADDLHDVNVDVLAELAVEIGDAVMKEAKKA